MINAKTWNPAQIDQAIRRLEGIIRSGSYNPAELNQILNQLGEPGYINTWNPAELDQKLRTLLHDLLSLKTATGNPIQLRTKNGGLVQSCEVTFSPIQSGSGDPSPTNVRPISGRDSLVLTRTGKNVCPINYIGTSTSESFTLKAGTYSFSFTLKGTAKYTTSNISIRDDSGVNVLSSIAVYNKSVGERLSASFTITEEITVAIFNANVLNDSDGKSADEIQIELGSTSAYEPYTSETYTATFPETVYGGKLDFVIGKAVIDKVCVDLGTLNFAKSTSYTNTFFYTAITTTKDNNGLCSNYKKYDSVGLNAADFGNNAPDNSFALNKVQGNQVYIRDDSLSSKTAEEFKTTMSGVQLCYELATPTEITLTAEQIELLTGANVLRTDGDNIEITYKKLLLPSDVESLSKIKKIEDKPKTKRSKKKKEE